MPLCTLTTTEQIADKKAMLGLLSRETARILGKDEVYVMVAVRDRQAVRFGGRDGACGLIEVRGLGLGPEQARDLAAELCPRAAEALSIPLDRLFLIVQDVPRSMWGWNGRTFA